MIRGQIEDQSKGGSNRYTEQVNQETSKPIVKKNNSGTQILTVLTEKEIKAVEKLKKNYTNKSKLIRDYIKNPQGITGAEKRRLYSVIQKARAKTAKEIFTKELCAIAYKLKNIINIS